MATVNSLAVEFSAQPHEVAAFADLGTVDHSVELDQDTESAIRAAWASVPIDTIDTEVENQNEDAVLDALYGVIEDAGYDY